MIFALTREPARALDACELTYREREPIDAERAALQHRGYCDALRACGARVLTLPPADELPDSVFVEDTAIVLDEVAVLTRPGVESRRGEVALIEAEVARLRPVVKVEPPATLEGGDVMRVGRTLYVGLSPRTNAEGASALRRFAAPHGYEVVAVEPRGCMHLKTGCSALDDGTVLANPEWVDASDFRGLEVLRVDASEPWAANVLRVGAAVCVGYAFPRTAAALSARGYDVRAVAVSEFAKAEGGMTCMSLIFRQP
ncbi:MAG TPA: arginine deiminase family protein [Pyrinomonadaceae bacterium]|nr:arginine deiminase family protein [Pyrinomonadaceae bacterium]